MLDATGKKLLRLLRPDSGVEVRRAAVLVLGETGLRDAELGRLVAEMLNDPDPALRLQALHTAGKLRIEAALPQLLARIAEGGMESEAAAHAAARLGPRGTLGLRELMGKVAPGLRRRIAGALTAAGASRAETGALDALLDSDPGVVDAAARSLVGEVPTLTAAQRKSLADQLLALLKRGKKNPLALVTESAVLRLLAAVQDPRADAVFWERTEPGHPPAVRAAALQGLGHATAESPTRDRLKRLLVCATDADFRVAAPALMMLRAVAVNERSLPDWLKLLEAPDVAVRRLALEKLKDYDTAGVADALIAQLPHPDRKLREEALAQLARSKHGKAALASALLEAETAEQAWVLARAQASFVREQGARLRERWFAQACSYLEAGDRRADALLFLLREADARSLRDGLEERALALRKKKQFAKALHYLRLLGRDPACAASLRFELAACGLKHSEHDLAAEARAADPSLDQFAHLLHSHGEEAFGYLEKAKWLGPEDLFYVGFHFAEKERQEKQFGGQVLRLVLKRSPKSQRAREAKSKLRREGLTEK